LHYYLFGLFFSSWWACIAEMPDTHAATLSLPLLKRTGAENKIENLMGWEADRFLPIAITGKTDSTYRRL